MKLSSSLHIAAIVLFLSYSHKAFSFSPAIQESTTFKESYIHDKPGGEDVLNSLAVTPYHVYLKTNVPAWAMLWMNIAGEVDVAHHWSVNLSFYYSGFNYFTGHRKFRTAAIMPEVRYWPHRDNQGFFVGLHPGLAWYNVAFGGEYRYQDHNERTPAIGGGVSAGFRMNLSHNQRWKLEASVGFGVYRLDYDLFENYKNGPLVGRKQRTFYGIDNAAISLCYTFDYFKNKKGGTK